MLQVFRSSIAILAMTTVFLEPAAGVDPPPTPMVRIAEIDIEPGHLSAYEAILREESDASVRLEPGVIAIFPMRQMEHPNQIRILEIYASRDAYQSHLQTPHFLHYKTATASMVKSLRLIEMNPLDEQAIVRLFRKAQ